MLKIVFIVIGVVLFASIVGVLLVLRARKGGFCTYCYEPAGDCAPDCPYYSQGGRLTAPED